MDVRLKDFLRDILAKKNSILKLFINILGVADFCHTFFIH